MEKKCRTCEFCYPRYGCSEVPLDHITTDYGCTEHKPRETPLLVDALGKALKTLLDEDVLRELVQQAKNFPNEPILNLIDDVAPGVFAVLDRYQKEVDDA